MNRHTAELLLLAALWGASFLFMRVAAPEFGPVVMIALRVGIAVLALAPFVAFDPVARAEIRAAWKPLLVVGISNSALPFCMFGYSMLYLNAGFDAILNATTPLWTAAIAAIWFRTRLTRAAVLGLVLGIVGVGALLSDTLRLASASIPSAIGAVLIATLSYGFAANYSKRHLGAVRPMTVAFASMGFATLLLAVPALLTLPGAPVSVRAWGATILLGLLCTGLAYVIYFRLIAHVGAAQAASVTFLIPIFGMIWGAVFLGERVTALMIAGCMVILLGAALITGRIRLPQTRSV
ncbi:DMT family transporter [Pararobbsia silviterrae]|uniref:DMT family transporter n=1 Tax=Pararobbsia silviterrae TaxID=1792498 RepID=A0A494XMD7_9BURK|nr:DMT family transporter [Pararobbsia silviterrae]RKP51788.1 DMT family transporter [Pararobbsia silviterrae]